MFWRQVGLCCCLAAASGCCERAGLPACAAESSRPAGEVHLGDGITAYHYHVIVEQCAGPVTSYYRPVLDHDDDRRLLGVGMLVMRDAAPCDSGPQ